MIGFAAEVNLRDVENGLRRMQLAGMNLRPVWKMSRRAFRADQRAHVKDREGQSGGWPALAQSTILHRKQRTRKQGRKRKWPIKTNNAKQLGRLPGAFAITFDEKRMTAKSRVPWSRVHWKGGTAGHHSKIPQREFMWISGELLRQVARNAVDYMATKWKRG